MSSLRQKKLDSRAGPGRLGRQPRPGTRSQPVRLSKRGRGKQGEAAGLLRIRRREGRAGKASRDRRGPPDHAAHGAEGRGEQRAPGAGATPALRLPSACRKAQGGGHLTTRANKVARQPRGHALSGRPAMGTSRDSSYPDFLCFLLLL